MIRQNILANSLGRAWGFVSVYLFIPLYLKYLGIEAYGLVGFYSTLLGVLAFADMGFTASLSREMARLSVHGDSRDEMRVLLRTYEALYSVLSALLATGIFVGSPFIVRYWLRAGHLPAQEMVASIRLMGVAIALQLPSGLYIGGLMGLEQQVRANALQIVWGLVRGVGVVLVLRFFAPTIIAFATWQVISNVLYCAAARVALWNSLMKDPAASRPRVQLNVFRGTWRYAVAMAGMAALSTLLTQTDKLAVSKMLTLEMLGYYSLASTIASLPLMLVSPIALAVFPKLIRYVETNNREGLVALYRRTTSIVAVAIIPAALTMILFATDFLRSWTGSTITAERAGMVASLLLFGQLLQAITVVPYYVALAHGNIKLNLQVGVASLLLLLPLLVWLVFSHGIIGAAWSWVLVNLCVVPPYMFYLHRRFLRGEASKWFVNGFGRPVLAALPCVLIGRWLLPVTDSRFLTLCSIALVWALSSVLTATASGEVRSLLEDRAHRLAAIFD